MPYDAERRGTAKAVRRRLADMHDKTRSGYSRVTRPSTRRTRFPDGFATIRASRPFTT